MPIVRIEILAGKSDEYKNALLDGINKAMTDIVKIPQNDRRQLLYELPASNFEHVGRSDNYTIIEITLFKGRSFETKKKLYTSIVENLLKNPGINGNDLTIILNEQPLENWGIRGGIPASELNLGFDINV